jgi:hypothetical protein
VSSVALRDIAGQLGGELIGDPDTRIDRIGPLASATAMMRGSLPKPKRRIRSGTSASIGVVTSIRM